LQKRSIGENSLDLVSIIRYIKICRQMTLMSLPLNVFFQLMSLLKLVEGETPSYFFQGKTIIGSGLLDCSNNMVHLIVREASRSTSLYALNVITKFHIVWHCPLLLTIN
jgi:hypothetical protein